MSTLLRTFTALFWISFCVFFPSSASAQTAWSVGGDEHFEIYSESGSEAARLALSWFEQLRSFFLQQTRLQLGTRPPVRVIGFRSMAEYQPYRRGATSNAYYVGTETSDYIVMATLDEHSFGVAAHEYAHLMFHASGLRLPLWLGEGLAEFYSTLQIKQHETRIGGDLPAHSRLLERGRWIPLDQLLASGNEFRVRNDRDYAALFYAESWALVQMMALSPRYSGHFDSLIAAASAGPGAQTLAPDALLPFGKSIDQVTQDLNLWLHSAASTAIALPRVRAAGSGSVPDSLVSVSNVPLERVQGLLAGVFLASGDLGRAENLYQNLAVLSHDGSAKGALAVIALMEHNPTSARLSWNSALRSGIPDPDVCFRYATLAQDAGFGSDEVRPALERAVMLRPTFDDARYNLALLESNSGNYHAALTQLRAIKYIPPVRTYNYWSCLGYVLTELDERSEAKSAAETALRYATTADERTRASQLAYLAQTDLTVQVAHDSEGRLQLVTARMRHNSTDWNPFIEPGDVIRHVQGTLQAINCNGDALSVQLDLAGTALNLSIPDPSRVQMRNAPAEFTCGAQQLSSVTVDYALANGGNAPSEGIIRGMDFGARP